MEAHPWLRPDQTETWVKARVAMYVGLQLSTLEILAGMPQPRD